MENRPYILIYLDRIDFSNNSHKKAKGIPFFLTFLLVKIGPKTGLAWVALWDVEHDKNERICYQAFR